MTSHNGKLRASLLTQTHLNSHSLTSPSSKSTFSCASYAASRPTYSASLYNTILAFHHHRHTKGSRPTDGHDTSGILLDLGCGPGIVARALEPHFRSVMAVDRSEGMVAQARDFTSANFQSKTDVRQAGVEDLGFLPDGSVDLTVAGQAAHWFDYQRAWPELARVVKEGGSLAFWGYKDAIIVGYPQAGPISRRFSYEVGEVRRGMQGLGRFWEEPGRGILQNSYEAIEPPGAEWADVARISWDPDEGVAAGGTETAPEGALWLRNRMRLGGYEAYIRTYSSFNSWRAAYPEKKSRAEGGEGDVVDAMFEEIVGAVPEWKAMGKGWRDVEVECVWGTCLLMARRR